MLICFAVMMIHSSFWMFEALCLFVAILGTYTLYNIENAYVHPFFLLFEEPPQFVGGFSQRKAMMIMILCRTGAGCVVGSTDE